MAWAQAVCWRGVCRISGGTEVDAWRKIYSVLRRFADWRAVGVRSDRNASCQICSAMLTPLSLSAGLEKKAESNPPVPRWSRLRSGSLRSPKRSRDQRGTPSRFSLGHQQLHRNCYPCLCTKCYPCLCTQPTPALSPAASASAKFALPTSAAGWDDSPSPWGRGPGWASVFSKFICLLHFVVRAS